MSDRLLIGLGLAASAAGALGTLAAFAHGATVLGVTAAALAAIIAAGSLLLACLTGAETREALT